MSDGFMDMVLANKDRVEKRPYFKSGKYNVKITKVSSFQSQKPGGGPTFLVEATVQDFQNDENSSPMDFQAGSGVKQLWTTNNPKAGDNITDFIVGCYRAVAADKGLDPNEISINSLNADRYNAMVGPDSAIVSEGTVVGVIGEQVEKKTKPGEYYVRLTWGPALTFKD